jgi:RNA polymerase sigma factor (sigma-70 family)
MATGPFGEVIHQIRPSVFQDDANLTDDQLLDRFTQEHDATALTLIIRRHGPMVWGVCRRILRSHQDAEDAFQATFLILVRKAASVRPSHRVAAWLYGVARKTALHARSTVGRRSSRESQVEELPELEIVADEIDRDQLNLLDAELSTLPRKYRDAIVLCDLEGKTRTEAARECNVPEGTMAGWLTRGRALLAKRLARRDVSFMLAAAVLSRDAASGGVPNSVLSATIRVAIAEQSATSGELPSRVAILVEEVLKTMLLSKLKTLAAIAGLILTLTIGAGAILNASGSSADSQPPYKNVPPAGLPSKVGVEVKKVSVRDPNACFDKLVYSPDGNFVVTIGNYPLPVKNDIEGNKAKKDRVEDPAAAFEDDNLVAVMKVWDAKTGELKKTLVEENKTKIIDLAITAKGSTAAILLTDGKLLRFGTSGNVSASPIAGFMANPKQASEIRIYDTRSWELKQKLREELKLKDEEHFEKLALSTDGAALLIGGISPLTKGRSLFQVWDIPGKKLTAVTDRVNEKQKESDRSWGYQRSMLVSADGKTIATDCNDGQVRLFDAGSVTARKTFGKDVLGGQVQLKALSPDGKTFAAVTKPDFSVDRADTPNTILAIRDSETGKVVREIDGGKVIFTAAEFSANGKLLATGTLKRIPFQSEVTLWDIGTGERKASVMDFSDEGSVESLAFAPNGQTLAIGGGVDIFGNGGGNTRGVIKFVPLSILKFGQ